jgi:major membrane immunogen (membrane-anchored lipoprotein)
MQPQNQNLHGKSRHRGEHNDTNWMEETMKRSIAAFLILTGLAGLVCKTSGRNGILDPFGAPSGRGIYKNGLYEGATAKDMEGYHASAALKVWGNRIQSVEWGIYDNNRHRFFDSTYEEVYADYPPYIQQCRDNMKGMVAYGPRLIETQSVDSVECITGATWCFNKFKQVIRIALKDATLETSASN